ncbi:conserved hypothetical protein [Beggiatoa sp. PS]|nr:conserved hypothetical protein [Beggiatoa sp. PS]
MKNEVFLDTSEVRLIPTTTAIWEQATRFRAKTGLKTPDAIHAATALVASCTLFIINWGQSKINVRTLHKRIHPQNFLIGKCCVFRGN